MRVDPSPAGDPRRALPGVDRLLVSASFAPLRGQHPDALILRHLRALVEDWRVRLTAGPVALPDEVGWAQAVLGRIATEDRDRLRTLINATGVVLHTNLGRALLSDAARRAVEEVAASYSTLEYDLERGERGGRGAGVRKLLSRLVGAEDALVVNNASGALVLALAALSRGGATVVSRGELIEIGGGFRIPEVVEAAGTRLTEVGTTNRTRIGDYERALKRGGVGALLKVHPSNFRMAGFTEEVELADLVQLGAHHGVPVVHDLGTGALVTIPIPGLAPEPRVQESVRAGAALVVFSGDKLLGGPQAGALVGWREAVASAARHPLARALRADKLSLAALEATLDSYVDPGRAWEEIPVLRMIAEAQPALEQRAGSLKAQLAAGGWVVMIAPMQAVIGGGTLPGVEIASAGLVVEGAARLAARLRAGSPPVVGRVEGNDLFLDLRTVLPQQDEALLQALGTTLTSFPPGD